MHYLVIGVDEKKRQIVGMQARSVGIHDGIFHADEVTACALLLLFNKIDRDAIFRTRDPKILNTCEYVCDVGGKYTPQEKLFDHHQVEYQGELSSAGMILQYLRDSGDLEEGLFAFLREKLVSGVDAHDNGRLADIDGQMSFSNVISNYVPHKLNTPDDEMMDAFLSAVDFTRDLLEKLRGRYRYIYASLKEVEAQMEGDRSLMEFDTPMPWIESFFKLGGAQHGAKFVLMPKGEHWKLRGIPPKKETEMAVRVSHPKTWCGLSDEPLKKETGIEGAVFCHKGGFISIWETRESAKKAYEKIMSISEKE